MFRFPYFKPKPDAGTQLFALGQGGPSGCECALEVYHRVSVPVSGRHGFGFPNWPGSPLTIVSPVLVPLAQQQDYTVINGLMKVPGKGISA